MQVNPAQAHISTPHTTEFSRIICMKLSVFFGWCSIFTRGGDSLRTAAAIVEALFSPEGGNYHKQILKNVNGASSGMMWYWQVFLIGQSILSYKRQQSLVLVFSHSFFEIAADRSRYYRTERCKKTSNIKQQSKGNNTPLLSTINNKTRNAPVVFG